MATTAPKNWLALTKRLREKSGSVGTGPVTCVGQTGENARLANWVNEAWNEIQLLQKEWKWMRKDFSFQTAANKIAYLASATVGETGVADLAHWHTETFRIYQTSIGRADEQFLLHWDYSTFRDAYDYGLQPVIASRPGVWTRRDKDKAILLAPTPDQVYTVTGQYQAAPSEFTADADLPELPPELSMIIVYKAMMLYGSYEAAPEVYSEGEKGFDRLYSLLKDDQLEPLSLGEPLA